MGQSTEELRRDIEATRSDMGATLDALEDRLSPGRVAQRQKNRFSAWTQSMRDRVMGTVLTRVDLSRLQFYDYYRSSAYLKPYGTASLHAGAAR